MFELAHPLVHHYQSPFSPSLEPLIFNVPFFISCVLFYYSLLILYIITIYIYHYIYVNIIYIKEYNEGCIIKPYETPSVITTVS